MFSSLQFVQYLLVCSVHLRGVYLCEVDAGGVLAVVAQPLADDGQGDVLAVGDAGPGVACHRHGEGMREAKPFGKLLQVVVDALLCQLVLVAFILLTFDEWQQKW